MNPTESKGEIIIETKSDFLTEQEVKDLRSEMKEAGRLGREYLKQLIPGTK